MRSAFHRRRRGKVRLDVVRKSREGEPQGGRGERCEMSQERNPRSWQSGQDGAQQSNELAMDHSGRREGASLAEVKRGGELGRGWTVACRRAMTSKTQPLGLRRTPVGDLSTAVSSRQEGSSWAARGEGA